MEAILLHVFLQGAVQETQEKQLRNITVVIKSFFISS